MKTTKKDYKLDFATQTLTITAAFAEAADEIGSEEYNLVMKIKADFPNISVVHRTHATPKKYRNKFGVITEHNQYKNLTYDRMERFMCALPNSTEYLEMYYTLREKADEMCLAAPYAAVRAWFEKQFPKYRENPLFYVDNEPEFIDFADILDKAEKKAS
ncbi:MAG: hypothetical protein IJG40_04475 [Oscillospiraceae bacterium]|nr:hypothetical protein [Oscillospiraceae bacterium]